MTLGKEVVEGVAEEVVVVEVEVEVGVEVGVEVEVEEDKKMIDVNGKKLIKFIEGQLCPSSIWS